MTNETFYLLALAQIPKIGSVLSTRLVCHFGSAEAVFKAKINDLKQVEHISNHIAQQIHVHRNAAFTSAEKEQEYCHKNDVNIISYSDERYSKRLRECCDAPLLLFCKGNINFNTKHVVAVVGTRMMSEHGKNNTANIVNDLSQYDDTLIISGLAAGIDTAAHQSAVQLGMPTIGILGHGLKTLYPANNKNLSLEMQKNGGLVTEFFSNIVGDPTNFPRRNRIIAGLADAIIVVEARIRGGALITADIGFSYQRDIFAVPGRISDKTSEGCNNLIKQTKAHLLMTGHDLAYIMGWMDESLNKKQNKTSEKRPDLSPIETEIATILQNHEQLHIDELSILAKLDTAALNTTLLYMEFKGYISVLPGKRYKYIF